MKQLRRMAKLTVLAFIIFGFSTVSSARPSYAQVSASTGHGTWVTGTMVTLITLQGGWVNVTDTFSSQDLMKAYGFSTIVMSQKYQGPTGTATVKTTQTLTLFVLKYDETPVSGSSSTKSATIPNCSPPLVSPVKGSNSVPQACGGGGTCCAYPSWTYTRAWSWGCWCYLYVQEDPVNFLYMPHPLNDIVSFLINSRGWYDSSNCSGTAYIYDPSGYGFKTYDRTLGKGGCTDSSYGRLHVRLFVMANGVVVAPVHQELWDWNCFCHHVMSWENAEWALGNDEIYQYNVVMESTWLANSGYFGYYNSYNDGWASTVT